MNSHRPVWPAVIACLLVLLLPSSVDGEIIYDNSTTYTGTVHSVIDREFGDEVWLASDGAIITEFQLQYYVENKAGPLTGNERAEIYLRFNDGPLINGVHAPGTVFYDSGLFAIKDGDRRVTISGVSLPAPKHFSWTIEFTGFTTNETAALLLFQPVEVGFSPEFYWEFDATGWEPLLLNAGSTPANFGARFKGIPQSAPRLALELAKDKKSITLKWPGVSAGFVVQEKNANEPAWRTLKVPTKNMGDHFEASVPASGGAKLYRLVGQ